LVCEKTGGYSNDVLVFWANEGVNPQYLYYVLSNDTFFDYTMVTSKGTKMPRGDKLVIMKYEVPDMTNEGQSKIVEILSALDNKIDENRKINHHLAA
jgi:Restriction endonuclease S subunits